MKKIIFVLLMIAFSSTSVFSAALDSTILTSTKLSNQVSGSYYSNNSAGGADDATSYVLSTGHRQGTKVYAGGSFSSSIFERDIAGDTFASGTDLIGSEPTWASGIDDTYFTGASPAFSTL